MKFLFIQNIGIPIDRDTNQSVNYMPYIICEFSRETIFICISADRHDPTSVIFVAEELNSDEYPELVYWSSHQRKHHCFQPDMHQGAKTLGTDYDRAVQDAPHVYADTVTSVRFKNGKIVKVRGRGRH